MTTFNDIQIIKREFFSRRNGVIVDALRKTALPYRIIFGLTLPQIKEIAEAVGLNGSIAEKLWENRTTRESAMLAPYLFPEDYFTKEYVLKMIEEAPAPEIIDILCMSRLRNLENALTIADVLSSENKAYPALRLYINLIQTGKIKSEEKLEEIKKYASGLISDQSCGSLARQVTDEISFLAEG